MIPIKILCRCGQKYTFDVEPIGGRTNRTVQCPACGTDGTAMTNQLIAQHLADNSAPASGLRITRPQRTDTVPEPPRPLAAVAQDVNAVGVKVSNKWLILALSGAVVFLLVLTGAVMFGRGSDRKAVPVAPVAGGNGGLPQTLAHLNAWYVEPPVGQSAATFYLKGFDALQMTHLGTLPILGKGQGQLPPPGAPIPASMKSALTAFLKSNEAALQLFAQGAKYDRCRYPLDLTLGYDALYPHCKKLEVASSVLELSAIYHAEENQAEQAAGDILNGLALADSLANEPTVLSQLARTWSVSYALAALEQTVNRTVLPAGAVSELANIFQRMEGTEARGDGFSRAMVGARVMALAALADPQQLLRALSAPDLKMSADRRSQIIARLKQGEPLTAERDFFEAFLRRLMAARQEPFPARLKSDAVGHDLVAEALDKKLVVLDLVLPSLGRRTAVEAESLARLRLGWTAMALEQFRVAHGNRYPASLSELTPDFLSAIPADPFCGQPLRYQKKRAGYALYSVGPDLKDDSGQRKKGGTAETSSSPSPRPRAQFAKFQWRGT